MKSPFWLLAGALLAGSVQAIPHYGPGVGPGMGPGPYARGPMVSPQLAEPAAVLRAGMDKLLGFLGGDQRPSPEALAAFLDNEIAPFFDFAYMTESAGGRMFERLDEQGQQAMVDKVRQSFLSKMAEKLGGYEQQQVRFLPPRGGNNPRTAQVGVAILNSGRYPSRLDFRLYHNGDEWLVYDVSANGQSAIVHYRNQLMRDAREQRMRQMRNEVPSIRHMRLPPPPRGYPPGLPR